MYTYKEIFIEDFSIRLVKFVDYEQRAWVATDN